MSGFTLACVLFDLDGTLVDTAPDLVACLNQTITQAGYSALSNEQIQPYISYGAAAMIHQATPGASEATRAMMLDDMLDLYQRNIAQYSRFFDGIPETLELIERNGLKWGVVTNKRERFTQPLMQALDLHQRAACMISGDTTPYSKPHPEPMLAACHAAHVAPENCIYIGDAIHDILAGKRAHMKTLAALYGYLKKDDRPETWGADALIDSPQHLTSWIQASLCK